MEKEEAERKEMFLPVLPAGARVKAGLRYGSHEWVAPMGEGFGEEGQGQGGSIVRIDYLSTSEEAEKGKETAGLDFSIAEVEGRGDFGSVRVAVNPLRRGKWYYEVVMESEGLVQMGWAAPSFEGNSESGDGIGDDDSSFSFDGSRGLKWHGESEEYGKKWKVGDVVSHRIFSSRFRK